jgi:hypothetical protein
MEDGLSDVWHYVGDVKYDEGLFGKLERSKG